MKMKVFRYFLIIATGLFTQACALVDGYKDNQHSWWAKSLSPDVKAMIDKGEYVELEIQDAEHKGTLIAFKGDPKYGKYNFVETGEWDEAFEYSQGDFKRGNAKIKATYDRYGNTLSRIVSIKDQKDVDFYISEITTSQLKVFNGDTVLTQEFKTFNQKERLIRQFETATIEYRQMLSDRLKKKIMIGRSTVYDNEGNLRKETHYRYEDKVPAK
jgi:hypothetical protein